MQALPGCTLNEGLENENQTTQVPTTRWDKGDSNAGITTSWIRPVHGTMQEQEDGSTIMQHASTGRWLRVDSETMLPWETTNSHIAVHGHSYRHGAQGVRRTAAVTLQTGLIEVLSKQLWEEWCDSNVCKVQAVAPQPPPNGRRDEIHYIITLDDGMTVDSAVIVDVFNEEFMTGRITATVHRGTEAGDVIFRAFRHEQCQPVGLHLCVVNHVGRDYRMQDQLQLPHATYVEAKKLSLEESFCVGHFLCGLYRIAQEVHDISQGHFTAEDFHLHHRIHTGDGIEVQHTTFRGQDLLTRSIWQSALGDIDTTRFRGYVDDPQPPVAMREYGRGFWITWSTYDMETTGEQEDAGLHLQQLSAHKTWTSAPGPGFKLRYDPDEFDQEHDTVIDNAIFPIPTDVNDEVLLPARHLWRNHHEVWPIVDLVRQEYRQQARLDTYGLRNHYLSNRIVHLTEGGPQDVMRAIAHVWYDYAMLEHLNVYLVTPQPPDTGPGTVALIAEFPTTEWDYIRTRAVLIDTIEDGTPVDRRAEYITHRGRARQVVVAASIGNRCWPNGIDDCAIFTRNQLHSIDEVLDVGHGDYITINVVSFVHRYASILGNFPSAGDYARDFMWRSGHYNQNLFTLFIYGIQGQQRFAPITLERDTTTFRSVDTLWYDVHRIWEPFGASQRSILYQVWPQNIYHAEQYAIHLVLDLTPNFPLRPVLVTIVVQAGGLRAQRIETRAWQLPARITLFHFMTLVGYAGFAREYAIDAYITHAGTQHRGSDTQLRLIHGGNYELRLIILPLMDFVAAVAARTPTPDPEQESGDHEDDHMELLQRQLRIDTTEQAEITDTFSMMQLTVTTATIIATGSASYTDVFLERVGPVTPHGERMLLIDTDLHTLRESWRRIEAEHGIPRPIDLATYIIHRVPVHGTTTEELLFDVARFDDPSNIPTDIEMYWPDIEGQRWKLHMAHTSIREARTESRDGWHFLLATDDAWERNHMAGGWIEFVSRFQEDEHSCIFAAALPHRTTWTHVWNWMRLGIPYAQGHVFTLQHNGQDNLQQDINYELKTGFFLQIVAHAKTETDFLGIPKARAQGWQRDLRLLSATETDVVYRAAQHSTDSQVARLSRLGQEEAILTRWPDLSVWNSQRVHWPCTSHGPPWRNDAQSIVINPSPNGLQVAIVCTLYEGGGARNVALILYRYSYLTNVYVATDCHYRCISDRYVCSAAMNGDPVTAHQPLNLEEGDCIEIFIAEAKQQEEEKRLLVWEDDQMANNHDHTTAGEDAVDSSRKIIDPRNGLAAPWYATTANVDEMITVNGGYTEDNAGLRSATFTEEPLNKTILLCGIVGTQDSILRIAGAWIFRKDYSSAVGSFDQVDRGLDAWIAPTSTVENSTQRSTPGKMTANDVRRNLTSQLETITSDGSYTEDNVGLRSATGLEEPPRQCPHINRFCRLPPPGNGPEDGIDLDKIDDCIRLDGQYEVVDYDQDHIRQDDTEHPDATLPVDTPLWASFRHVVEDEPEWDTNLPDIEWHQSTQEHIHTWTQTLRFAFEEFQIYTDGSAGSQQHGPMTTQRASWAFAVWATMHTGQTLLHQSRGHVVDTEEDPHWHGAAKATSIEGERAALIAAALWANRALAAYRLPITFHFDNTAAGFGASGQWRVQRTHQDAVLLRCLMQTLAERNGQQPGYRHVLAHTGDPHNEFVDTLAYDALKKEVERAPIDFDVHEVLTVNQQLCAHWPLLARLVNGDRNVPNLTQGQLQWAYQTSIPNAEIVWQDFTTPQATITSDVVLQLRCITYNARTLKDNGEQAGIGVTALLRAQLTDKQYDIIFLQETRTRQSRVQETSDYRRYISAANATGGGGTEIWLSKKSRWTPDGTITWKLPNHVVVLESGPEWLILRLDLHGHAVFLISAHAPHAGHDKVSLGKWWTEFDRHFGRLVGQGTVIMGIDANAHFQDVIPGAVGDAGLEQRANHPSRLFGDFLSQWGMWLPSTFTSSHYGPHGTWLHPHHGTWHRCDYFALSGNLCDDTAQTWVDGNIDAAGTSIDHMPLALQLYARWPRAREKAHNKRQHIDLLALKTATPQQVEQALHRCSDIPWDTDIHEHGAQFIKSVREELAAAFPTQRKGPHRDYITKETWDLRNSRRTIRRRMYKRHQEIQRTEVCAAFTAWKHGHPLHCPNNNGKAWYLRSLLQDVHDRHQLRLLGIAVKKRLKQDRDKYCKDVAEEASILAPSLVIQKMRCIGVTGKRRRREAKPLQQITGENGELLTDAEAINARWQQHFEELEDGEECDKVQLLQRCVQVQRRRVKITPTWEQIPTLWDVEESFRLNKTGRASFFDGIPTDICHLFPQILAKVFYGLALKQTLQIAEPMTFKGGVLVHAYKGKGPATSCSSYRSLMVSSVMSKSLHRILRGTCMKNFQMTGMPLQIGGMPGKAVSQGAHSLLAFASSCRRHNASLGILFIDIRQAFYRLVRQHIVHEDDFDAMTQRLFKTLGLPNEAFQEFAKELADTPAVVDADMPPFVEKHVAECLNATWFKLKDGDKISATRKGSRPGDNMADLLFTFAFRRIMNRILDVIEQEGISMSFTGCGEARPFIHDMEVQYYTTFRTLGPVWADDLAILMTSHTAQDLLPKIRVIARTVIDMLAIYGMQVNCDRGKSELVLDLRGKGAHAVKRELFRHKCPCVDVETRHQGTIFLNVVAKYRHLGTVFAAKGSMVPEIRQRIGQARGEFQRYRKQIYANAALPVRTRVELFKSMVLSGLSFNVAVWPALTKQEHISFCGGLHSLYSSLAFAIWGEVVYEWREEQAMAKLQVLDGMTLMSVARLRHLYQLTSQGDEYIWAFIHNDEQWLGLIAHDLLWLQRQCCRSAPSVDPRDDWQPWEQLLADRRGWKRMLRRAERHSTLQVIKKVEWYCWHKQLLYLLRDHGLWSDKRPTRNDTMHGCLRCQLRFATKAAWSVHCFKLHGRVTSARAVAQGETCVVCHKIYATHDRLINHLRYSQRCFREMRRRFLYTNPQPARNSTVELKQRHEALRPTMPVQGPVVQEEDGPMGRYFDKSEEELLEGLIDLFNDYEEHWRGHHELWTEEYMVRKVWENFQNSTSYPAEMKLLLGHAITEYSRSLELEDEDDVKVYNGLEAVYTEVSKVWCRDWIMGHLPTEKVTSKTGHGELDPDEEFGQLCGQTAKTVVPRALKSRVYIFLHLFSGHRREDDVQACVETYNHALGGQIKALSVDLVISATWGDVADPTRQRLFLDGILQGWIAGVVSGPPCETWSKAREEHWTSGHGPRPVRSALEPWGLELLTTRELQQIVTGNSLLGISILMFLAAWISGTFAMVEHPMEPGSTTSASIWKLAVMRYIASLPKVQKITVYQGFFGAPSGKPTTLIFANAAPQVETIFRDHQIRRLCPTATSIGRDTQGRFKTAILKAYPPAFCKAIAAAWYTSVRGRLQTDVDEEIPDEINAAVVHLHSSIGDSKMGPDYHGTTV